MFDGTRPGRTLRRRCRRAAGVAALLGLAAAVAGCGSSSTGASGPTEPPGTTPPAGPRLELSASTDLADLQEVEVEGSGFEPGVAMVVLLCGPEPGDVAGGCELPRRTAPPDPAYVTPDENGGLSTTVAVRSSLYTQQDGIVDCVAATCRLVVAPLASPPGTRFPGVELGFDPSSAGVPDHPTPPGECEAPYAPFGSRRWVSGDPGEPTTEALTPDGIEGDEVPVERVRAVQAGDVLQFELVLDDGVVRTLTTTPDELGGHYPNRVQGRPGETPLGTFSLVVEPDGTRDVVLRRANSGDYSAYAWHVDDPCGIGA